MSRNASKAAIGAFVLGAICLVVAGVVFLGSGKLFTPLKKVVMYFDGSVKGLSVGAPVVFRGVKIGSVVDIVLQGDLRDMKFKVPVVAEIDLSRFRMSGVTPGVDYQQTLVDQGLRAQLQTQSLVTGQLMVYFDFYPDKPPRLTPDTTGYSQIPTIPSAADELAQKLEELPLKQLLERANAAVGGLERLVNSPDVQNAPRALNSAAADARTLLEKIGGEVGRVSSDARGAIAAATAAIKHADRVLAFEEGTPAEVANNLNLTLSDARALLARIDGEVGSLSSDARGTIGAATAAINRAGRVLSFEEGAPAEAVNNLNRTLVDARTSLRKLDETLDSVQKAATDERTFYQLRSALEDLGQTSRSLGLLVDYLNQHPEALLRGKTNLKER